MMSSTSSIPFVCMIEYAKAEIKESSDLSLGGVDT